MVKTQYIKQRFFYPQGIHSVATCLPIVLGLAYRGLTGGFLLLQNCSAGIFVSPHVCFILDLILISMILR